MSESEHIRDQIYASMQLKTTPELQQIWEDNNRAEWTDIAFLVVRDILIHRTGEIPPAQKPYAQMPRQKDIHRPIFQLPKDHVLRASTVSFCAVILLWLVINILFPLKNNSKYEQPIGFLFMLGVGTSVSCMFAALAYRAWTHDARGYRQWIYAQYPSYSNIAQGPQKWMRWLFPEWLYPDWLTLWTMRIFGPPVVLMTVFGTLAALYGAFKAMFG